MAYQILFAPRAERDFRKLPREVQVRIKTKIDRLGSFPRPAGVEKLSGEEELYRVRAGDYRVIYEIRDKMLVVLVVKIGHRREIYR